MSLEEQLSALVSAIEANTDAQLQVAAAIRGQFAAGTPKADPIAGNATTETSKPRGRPPKNTTPPPAPMDLAQQGGAPAATPPPAATGTQTSATPASAPAAASGSGVPDTDEQYKELAALVPEFAAKHGRTKTMEVFENMGFKSGVELRAKAPARIGEAIRLFREKL